jgi:hypothetical protein
MCQEQDLFNETDNLRSDLQLSGYPQYFNDSVLNCQDAIYPDKEKIILVPVYIPYMRSTSEKLRHTGNCYNIRTILKNKHSLRSSLMRKRLVRYPQQTAQCFYSIPCECGRVYVSKTGRPLAVWLREHRHNLQQGLLENQY